MRLTLASWAFTALILLTGTGLSNARFQTNVHHGLALESEIHDVSPDQALLDAVITAANTRIHKKRGLNRQEAIEALKTIHQILQEQQPDFISYIFRENDCKTSIIYIAVGEALGLPIRGVVVPNHIFVRYELPSGEYINWETLYGEVVPDENYIQEHQIAEISILNGAYMRSLNPSEITALHYVILGKAWGRAHEYDKAMRYYNDAVRRYPSCPGCYNQRGIGWLHKHNPQNALRDFNEALNLDPRYAAAFYNRALAFLQQNQPHQALADLNHVLELNPDHANSLYWRGFVNMRLGRQAEAATDLERSIKLDPDLRRQPDYTR